MREPGRPLRALLCLAAWYLPVLLLALTRLIPQDPDAPANNFGQVGPRQTVFIVLLLVTPVIWFVASAALRLGYLWLLLSVVLALVLLYGLSFLAPMPPAVGFVALAVPPVVAALLTRAPERAPGDR